MKTLATSHTWHNLAQFVWKRWERSVCFRCCPWSERCSRSSTEPVFSSTVWMTGSLSWTWREWQRKWVSEQMKQFLSHGCLKMWWCTVNLWLEPDKTLILLHWCTECWLEQSCQVTGGVVFLITPAYGHTGVLEPEGLRYVCVLYYMDVCFSLQTLKQDLALGHKENSNLKSQNKKAEAELAVLNEAVHRWKQSTSIQNGASHAVSMKQRFRFIVSNVAFGHVVFSSGSVRLLKARLQMWILR